MPFTSTVEDPAEKSDYIVGFNKALNTVQDSRLIDDENLSQAQNVMLEVNGVSRRYGTERVWDEGGGDYIYGSHAYYNKSTSTTKYVRVANNRLQYLDGVNWTNVDATVFTNTETNFIQAMNELFIYNGTDNLRRYDGSSILTYTALTTPTNLTVTSTGGTASTSYSYRIAAFNSTGETDACTAVSISNGHAEDDLSASKYIALDWDDVVGADGYNVYGRTSTGYGEVYLATVYESAYNDTGSDDLTTTKLPSEDNNTGGLKGKGGCFTNSRQFVYGVTEGTTYYPTRLYYSGTLDFVDSFVGGDYGGGWVEVYANDGGEIVALEPFQDGVLVFKTNGIFRFYFTSSGLPALQEITREHGGVSGRGVQTTENDILYIAQKDNRLAVMTIGYEENYVDQLRTNETSVYISDQLENVNRNKLSNIATWKFKDTFGFTLTSPGNTTNSRGFVLDTRFGGWVFWNGLPMEADHYSTYDDGTNLKLYAGSNSDGYMIEMFKDERNDDGSAFTSIIGTKFYNGDMFDVDKVWRNPTLWFEYVTGGASIEIELWKDGNQEAGTASITTDQPGLGAGADKPGTFLAGNMASGFTIATERTDVPVELLSILIARSVGFYIIDANVNSNWLFMGIHLQYSPLVGKPADGVQRVNLT